MAFRQLSLNADWVSIYFMTSREASSKTVLCEHDVFSATKAHKWFLTVLVGITSDPNYCPIVIDF